MANDTTSINSVIAENVSQLLVQPLEAASVVLANGVTIFDTAAPLRIPKITAGVDVGFVAEGAQIPTDDVTFDELNLMPSNRKSLKVITTITNEAIRQAVVGVDAVLKQRLVTDVANKLDSALLSGDGSANTITGITEQAGASTGVFDPTDPDTLMDGIATLRADDVTPNKIFVNGADWSTLSKIKEATTSKRYLFEANIHAGPTYSFAGIEVVPTNKLAQGTVIVADTSKIAVARDIDPSVTVDQGGDYFAHDVTAIRVVCRYDLGLIHDQAVVILGAQIGS